MFGNFVPSQQPPRGGDHGCTSHPSSSLAIPGMGGGKCCDVKSGRNEEQHLFSRSNVKFMKVTPEMKFPTDTV